MLVRNGGSALGEIDDDLVTVAVGGRAGRAFRQIEFELDESENPHADPMVVERMLTAMKKAGAHIDLEQKFAKALGTDARTRNLSATKIGRKSTLGQVVQTTLRSEFERLLDFDVSLRLHPQSPSERAIHQARVATRRLRSDLKTFGPVLDPVWLRHTRSELKWIGTVLGAVRDIDVLDKRFQSDDSASHGSRGEDALRTRLASQRRDNTEELAHVLRSERYLNLLDRLDAGTSCPGFTSACNPRRREILKSGRPTSHGEPSPGFCDLIGGNYVEGSAKLDRHPATPSSTRYGLPRSNSDTEPNWPSRCWARPPVEPPAVPKTSKQSSETIMIPSPPSSGWNRSLRTARRRPALSLEARRPMRVAINSNRDSNGATLGTR